MLWGEIVIWAFFRANQTHHGGRLAETISWGQDISWGRGKERGLIGLVIRVKQQWIILSVEWATAHICAAIKGIINIIVHKETLGDLSLWLISVDSYLGKATAEDRAQANKKFHGVSSIGRQRCWVIQAFS